MDASDRARLASAVAALEVAVDTLVDLPVPESDTPDVVGRVQAAERKLSAWRRALLSESVPTIGEDYKIEEKRSAERSYNTPRIFADLAMPVLDVITAGAVDLTWKWTGLKNLFIREGIDMVVAQRELGSADQHLDAPHVGEVWRSRTSIAGLAPPRQ